MAEKALLPLQVRTNHSLLRSQAALLLWQQNTNLALPGGGVGSVGETIRKNIGMEDLEI